MVRVYAELDYWLPTGNIHVDDQEANRKFMNEYDRRNSKLALIVSCVIPNNTKPGTSRQIEFIKTSNEDTKLLRNSNSNSKPKY